MGGSATLARVERGRLCTGCGACAALSGKIRMQVSPRGYNRPVPAGNLTEEEDRRIAGVCPGLGIRCGNTSDDDPLWGRMIGLRTGHATDPALRFRAASGGALSVHQRTTKSMDELLNVVANTSTGRPMASRSSNVSTRFVSKLTAERTSRRSMRARRGLASNHSE